MIQKVLMPLMGEGIEEATLVKWLKGVGDVVKEDEPLVEVSTDKVDTEIPSPFTGKITKLLVKEDTQAKVHEALAEIETSATNSSKQSNPAVAKEAVAKEAVARQDRGDDTSQTDAVPRLEVSKQSQTVRQTRGTASGASVEGNNQKSSPVVRKLAREFGVALNLVPGSGIDGKVTKRDIYQFMANPQSPDVPQKWDGSNPLFKNQTAMEGQQELLDGVPVKRQKMTKMRRLIAEHMNRSIRTSPHVTTTFEIDMLNASNFRKSNNPTFKERHRSKITFTHMIAYAAALAIKEYPIVNVSIDGDDLLFKDDINLGIAVAIESGLIVPVIKKCQNMDFVNLCKSIDEIVVKARSKKLLPNDVKGGTFSITNPGLYGSVTSNPIINQPQVAIMGVGQIANKVVPIEGKIVIRPMMYASLTFDHRAVDGELGAKYLAAFKHHLENIWQTIEID